MRNHSESPRGGFTLVELLVVIAIIGLIIALILVAAADGVRRAEERATQSLITKLETALNEPARRPAQRQAPINLWHRYLAQINTSGANVDTYNRRAQVIAQFDYLSGRAPRRLLPERGDLRRRNGRRILPAELRRGALSADTNNLNNFVVPLGVGYDSAGQRGRHPGTGVVPGGAGTGEPDAGHRDVRGVVLGGGGLYKQLGYSPQGYDGVDNTAMGHR